MNSCSIAASAASTDRAWGVMETISYREQKVHRLFTKDDGVFPNNPDHPVLVFPQACCMSQREAEQRIVQQGWTSPWAWGIYPYHHYHSTAWELLVCVQGQALVQLGGETGPNNVEISKGDVVLIPPGVAHKQLSASGGFTLLGAYPGGSPPVDVLRGPPTPQQRASIAECPVPETDPITGVELAKLYKAY